MLVLLGQKIKIDLNRTKIFAEYSSKRIKKVITLTLHAKIAKSDSRWFPLKTLSDKV